MEFILIGEETRDETGQMHPRMNALIHGWGKYPWMINLHEWGATTVAHHGFLFSKEIYHPKEEHGVRIRDVVDARPELDVVIMKLTASESHNFTDSVYFQAENPTRLVPEDEVAQGSWSEVDEMSSGLVLHCFLPHLPHAVFCCFFVAFWLVWFVGRLNDSGKAG